MKNSNIIISVIIVLCIAAGVSAYDITNPESNIVSLLGFTPSDSGDGQEITTDGVSGDGISTDTGSQGGSGVSGSGGSGNSGGSGSSGISASKAKTLASPYITEGTAGTPYKSGGLWIVPIMVNGTQKGAIYINATTGANEGGEGGAP